MRIPTLLWSLAFACRIAVAQDPAPAPAAPPSPPALTVEGAADAVLAALNKDDPRLKDLSSNDIPDPWLVADELIRRGRVDAALRFAGASPRGDVVGLPAYVEAHVAPVDDAISRAALAQVNQALTGGKLAAALAAAPSDGSLETPTEIRLRFGRCLALRSLGREVEASAPLIEVADAAERIGWLARAAWALHLVGWDAFVRRDLEVARTAWTRRAALEERRGGRAGAVVAASSLATLYDALGDSATAIATKVRSVRLLEQAGDPVATAVERAELAEFHRRAGHLVEARALLEQAVATLEVSGPASTRMNAHNVLGNVAWESGRSADALAAWMRVLPDAEALGDRSAAAQAQGNVGAALVAMGRHDEGLAAHERALALHVSLGDVVNACVTRANVANVLSIRGRYHEALAALDEALRAAEGVDVAKSPEVGRARAQIHGGIAHVLGRVGSLDDALRHDRAALALLDPVRDRHRRAHVLSSIGEISWARGETSRAFEQFEEAAEIYRSVGNAAGVAALLTNVGMLRASVGEFEASVKLLRQSIALLREIGDPVGEATALNDLGATYVAAGQDDEAVEAHTQALALRMSLGDPAALAYTRANLAEIRIRGGDLRKGLSEAKQAHREFESIGHRAGAAFARSCIAKAQIASGDEIDGLATLGLAIGEAEASQSIDSLVDALAARASLRLARGDSSGASDDAHRAVLALGAHVVGLADEQGSSARASHADVYATGAAAAARLSDPAAVAFYLENGRAGAQLEALRGRKAAGLAALPEALRVAEAQARAEESAAVREWRALRTDDLATARASRRSVEAAQEGVRDVVGRIQREAKRAAGLLYPRADDLAEIRRRLADDEALLLYGLFEREPLTLVVTARTATIVRLGATQAVERACDELLVAIDDTTAPASATRAAEALRDLVIKPLGLTPGTKRLLVSPDGALASVPFALLVPGLEVSFVPSGTVRGFLLDERGSRGVGVLALGDPDYTSRIDARAGVDRGRPALPPLPATRAEATAVGEVLLLGANATERALSDALAKRVRWRAVHLACHGLIDPARPSFSSLAMTAEGGDDGFLTVLEVVRARFPADLVVLSACDTAKGKLVKGEGTLGLTRAFIFAGASRVISSLWKVDDDATRALMTKFYELWNPKDGSPSSGIAGALRAAQEFVRSKEKWRHPHYWAAWVLWGLAD